LWLLAKWGFAVYVTEIVAKGNLYGALGLLPLFFIWVNLSWSIFLFGAVLAHTATNLNSMQMAEQSAGTEISPSDLLAAAIAVAQPCLNGQGPVPVDDIVRQLRRPHEFGQSLLDRLESAGIVCRTGGDSEAAYLLARPAQMVTILQVVGVESQPPQAPLEAQGYDPGISAAVTQAWARARSALGDFTLAEVIPQPDPQDSANTKTD